MLDQINKYSQKQLHIDMDEIATTRDKNKRDLFEPLMVARQVLTGKNDENEYDEWIDKLKSLSAELKSDVDDHQIVYRVLAILFYKYPNDIKYVDEDVLDAVDLDFVEYYNHFTNEEMQYESTRSKALAMLDKRNKILMKIAETSNFDNVRVQALKALDHYINSCLLPESPKAINVYGREIAVDASTGKSVGTFDINELQGQGDAGFKKMLNKKKGEIEEVEVMANESVDGKST